MRNVLFAFLARLQKQTEYPYRTVYDIWVRHDLAIELCFRRSVPKHRNVYFHYFANSFSVNFNALNFGGSTEA